MFKKKNIQPKNVWKPSIHLKDPTGYAGWNQAVKTGNILFIAGQVGIDSQGRIVEGLRNQIKQAYENMKAILKEAGATFDNVVYIMGFYVSPIDETWPIHRDVQQKYIKRNEPALTCCQILRLAKPEFLVEIEAIAVLDK